MRNGDVITRGKYKLDAVKETSDEKSRRGIRVRARGSGSGLLTLSSSLLELII